MKIFSWFHHQFDRKDAKKADNDKISLLENEGFDGILSIGTLGMDLFQDFKHEDDMFMSNNQVLFIVDHEDGEEDDHEEEMECPLVLKACKYGFEFDHVRKQDPLPRNEIAKPKYGQKDADVNDSTDLDFENAKKTIIKSEERTTLADLFRADSENNLLKNNNKLFDDHNPRVYHHDNDTGKQEFIKSSLISKKKEKLCKDGSSRPFKKTKQLMRKMLKKKIHPDIGIQKKEIAST